MTYEDAIELIKKCDSIEDCDYCKLDFCACTKIIDDAILEHHDKYAWHDLRKDLNDFPEFNGNEVEVMFLTEHGFYNIGYYGENGHYRDKYFRHSRDAYEGYDTHCVIAWKYIEPFESEVEE